MDPRLLKCIPKRFLCPYCGKWHKWNNEYYGEHTLDYYDGKAVIFHECDTLKSLNRVDGCYKIYFCDGDCCISISEVCERAGLNLFQRIKISSIVESSDKPIVTFKVTFSSRKNIGNIICKTCKANSICNLIKLVTDDDQRNMEITLGWEFEQSDYKKFAQVTTLAREEKELQESEQASKQPQATKIKEDANMANKIFNMNMEFGPNKDENIASTLMGVAVKNGDSWRIYDKKKKEITDVGDMQVGNLPIFILPTTQLSEGDLIKDAGEYYFVIEVQSGSMQTMCAKTGEMKNIVPIKNVLGFSCYSKVIALSDSLNIGDDFDVEKLAIMSAMCGQTGENSGQMNQLLPLMLFKDKFGGDDDMMKLLLMSSMMTSENDGGQMNQLLPLMLFKDKLGGDDDMMKLLLMSSMMGGNMAGSNNLLMSYLMLDAFRGKKDDKALQAGGGATK